MQSNFIKVRQLINKIKDVKKKIKNVSTKATHSPLYCPQFALIELYFCYLK